MKTKDLREGNLIYILDEDLKGTELCIDLNDMCNIECDSDRFAPIPITEEWLNKFGFDDSDYKKGYIGKDFKMGSLGLIGDFVLTKPKHLGDFQVSYVYELRNHRLVSVNYIHELQNLFFVLTGEELSYE